MSVENLSPIERRAGFTKAWIDHKAAGLPETQEELDKIAAEWSIIAPKLPLPDPDALRAVSAPGRRNPVTRRRSVLDGGGF